MQGTRCKGQCSQTGISPRGRKQQLQSKAIVDQLSQSRACVELRPQGLPHKCDGHCQRSVKIEEKPCPALPEHPVRIWVAFSCAISGYLMVSLCRGQRPGAGTGAASGSGIIAISVAARIPARPLASPQFPAWPANCKIRNICVKFHLNGSPSSAEGKETRPFPTYKGR